ncbi:MAG TPA: M1 family metallopeptidase [Patescibacteria group bacterium]|nr:M1 family metallopeptidase [Patescibacteria group bacterium]
MKKKPSVRLTKDVVPSRYRITLKPNFENFTFYGEETIFLSLKKPQREIVLHAKELKVRSAILKSNFSKFTAVKIETQAKKELLILRFGRTIPRGTWELDLTFEGTLNDLMRGFYRSKYTHEGAEKFLATTQFEATDARRALPCFDEPAQKAVFDVTLMIPKHMEAISNTTPHTVREHEEGLKVVEFQPTPKMSTYLLAFIIGEFEFLEKKTIDGVVVRVYTVPGKKKLGAFALDCAVKSLEFYTNYFKIKYPLPVLDMIAVPDFASGAMENWGAVTYRESALLFDERNSSSANRQWIAIVVAHELAHQWFGNLVTMEWWTHLWLNEGFASYMEYLAVDSLFPEWRIFDQFVADDHATALALDQLKTTHPIEVEVHHPNEIDEIFDQISYQKGASVIRMLAEYIGPRAFQKGLQAYLRKHSYSNAETIHLWEAFEKASGKPVRKMMSIWTGKSGYPLVKVIDKPNAYRLEQTRYFLSQIERKKANDKTIWPIPVSAFNTVTKRVTTYFLDKKSLEIPKGKHPVKFNYGETGVFRTDYSSGLLHNIPIHKLPPADRLGLVRDCFTLNYSLDFPVLQYLELLEKYRKEKDFIVWAELSSGVEWLRRMCFGKPYEKDLAQFNRELFAPIAKALGWQEAKNDAHVTKLLRSLVLMAMGKNGDPVTIAKAKKLFGSGKVNPDLRSVVYVLTAENSGRVVFEKMKVMHQKAELTEEKNRLLRGMCSFKDTALLKETLSYLFSEHVRLQDSALFFGLVAGNEFGTELAWKYLKDHYNEFLEKFGKGGHLLGRLISPFAVFTDIEFAKEFSTFFKKHGAPGAERTVTQVVEKIYARALWKKEQEPHLEKHFRSLTE